MRFDYTARLARVVFGCGRVAADPGDSGIDHAADLVTRETSP